MRIETPLPEPYTVDDYDFHFVNGHMLSFTIAKNLGDTIDFDTTPLAVRLHFVEKDSVTDPERSIPSEDITVLMQHVISVIHRQRVVTPPTLEERDLFQQSLHKLSKVVN